MVIIMHVVYVFYPSCLQHVYYDVLRMCSGMGFVIWAPGGPKETPLLMVQIVTFGRGRGPISGDRGARSDPFSAI